MKNKTFVLYLGIACSLIFGYFYIGNLPTGRKNVKEKENLKYYKEKIKRLENKIKILEVGRDISYAKYNITEEVADCSTIDIVIVCGGINASREVTVLIKSILFYRTNPIHVHFMVDKVSKSILSNLFRTWNIPQFTISFYLIDKLKPGVEWIPTGHYSGIYGLIKLALLNVLPKTLKRIIVLDIDLVFLSDIAEVRKQFEYFNASQAIGLVENQSEWYTGKLYKNYKPWPAFENGFNTGLILMDCTKLNEINWMALWREVTLNTLKYMESTALADQDVINAVIAQHSTIVYKLPCVWNVQLSMHSQAEKCYKKQIDKIKVVHWNSPLRRDVPNRRNKHFRNIYENFMEYSGNLLTVPLAKCSSDYEEQYYAYDATVDYCQHLLSKTSHLHRTHSFFLPYSYITKGNYDVTLLLQLSIDRLQALHSIAAYWKGPISVAIFLSDSDVRKFLYFVENSAVLSSSTNIGYHIVYRNFDENVYPINFLRNVALKYAQTEFVFTCDVDFVPSIGTYEYITNSILPSHDLKDKNAYIIPAFESYQYKNSIPKTKSELVKKLKQNLIVPFRIKEWSQGHNATDFDKWLTAKKVYKVPWEENFEPYVVVSKTISPKYDRRFVGFGWNKVSFIFELNEAGFQFLVLPHAFILHLPHSPSVDINQYRNSAEYRECLKSLKETFVDEIKEKYKH